MTNLADTMQRISEFAGRIGLALFGGLVAIVKGLLISYLVD